MNENQIPKLVADKLQKVDKTVDKLGRPIDEKIKLTVAALWALGFYTSNSCGGHKEYRNGGPFVYVISETHLEHIQILKSFKMPYGDDYFALSEKIKRANLQQQDLLLKILGEFYLDKQTPIEHRLIVETMALGTSRLACQGAQSIDATAGNSQRDAWLFKAQEEFADFTKLLIKKVA